MGATDAVEIRGAPGYLVDRMGVVWSSWYPDGVNRPYRVRDDLPERPLAPRRNQKGYTKVSIRREGIRQDAYIHRLVWETFHGEIPLQQQIRHLNGDPGDNRLVNLALGSQSDNEQDKYLHGTMPLADNHFNAKLTSRQVLAARGMWERGATLKNIQAELSLNVCKQTIHDAVRGKTWRTI